uniref:Putative ribonuclease H-like domain-containing protein n=1 Tax=Tanacetum cinerariifolium TaxID=118510 RepID=A0A6L2NH43_TANCI|nr:putative ribonuclease H-like domain-containing protein [Tanacetum cinerariifolium]
MKMNTTLSSGLGTLPGNIITNPKEELKGITTCSGTAYQGPTIPTTSSSLPPVVEFETEVTKDMVHPTNNGSTKDIQPLVVQTETLILNSEPVVAPIIEPVVAPVSAPKPNQRPSISYPSRLHDQKLRDKANGQRKKLFQIFKDLNFNISFADALILMPKFGPTIKTLLTNKEKLFELARTSLNEHCSAVLLKKLPEKLWDLGKFLIPCDFPRMAECLALADLGASKNLTPLSVWNKLSLPELSPTCMTLELADRLISHSVGVTEDVFVKVGTFHFLVDFVVIDFDADPRVPLILGRSFLKTGRALIDVFEGELTLLVGKEAITFNLDQTSRYSANCNDMTVKRTDVIDMACEEYSQEVLGFFDVIMSGNPTPYYDPIVSTTSPNLTPFSESDFLLEEVDAFLALENDATSPKPQVRKELKICEAKIDKSSIDEPSEVELKYLPPHLKYVFLEGDDKLPVIIAKDLSIEEKTTLITVLKSHKRAIAWKLSDIKGGNLKEEENNFMLNNCYGDKYLEELNAAVIMIARIQPTYDTFATSSRYDADILNENVNNKNSLGRDSKGGIIILLHVSFEEHVDVQRETKARTLLLQSLPEDHMDDFHHLDDAREIWLAVKARFGGNEESKKMRKTMLKQEFSEFGVSEEEEGLHKGYDSYDSRSTIVAPTHSAFIGAASTNTKMVYSDQPSHSSSITYTSAHSDSILEDVLHSFVAENEPTQQLAYEDFEQVDQQEMEELDIKWQMAMLSLRINKFQKKAGRKINFNNKDTTRFNRRKARCYNCLQLGHFARECNVKKNEHEAENKTEEGEQVYGLMAGFKSDFADHVGNAAGSVYNAAAEFAMIPKTNDCFSTVDVKILPKSGAKDPSPTNGFPSCSFKENVKPSRNLCNKSGIADRIHCKNNFVRTKKCFVCGSKSHLIKDYDVYNTVDNFPFVVSKEAFVPAASRNRPASHAGRHIPAGRFNKPTPFPAGRFVPTGWTNHAARLFFRPINLYFDNVSWLGIYEHMSLNEGRWGSAVKSSAGIVDSGCSRSIIGNKEKLDDFMQVKGGTVTFGGGDGKITGKGTIRTSKLNFENNKVLFTDGECLVLTKEFQLPDESQVVLRIPRRHDLYMFNLSDIQPEQQINCLLAKASLEESTKWHRRMAHVNFKTINKLAKHGLVEGPPLKDFTNEHNCTEAVSTACYVLNRVSITNPHNKTPYELLSGKVPNIRHLKPFGCQVTILNTSDHLGKFDGKANEGFLVGYAANSKAYRVYNLSSKKVKETLNLRYQEDKPNVQGRGQEWYFDLDYLIDSLGYTRFKNNTPAGTQDANINAGTQDDDSESECEEQAILVPSFPSYSFSGPKVNEVSTTIKNHLDYAEELARLQRQEHKAHSAAAKYGFEFSNETAEMLHQGVLAGHIDSVGFGDPATSESIPAVFNPDHADNSTLPPGHSLGSSEQSTRFPSPSNLGNHQPTAGIFSSSSYDDDFCTDVTNLASSVVVDPVATKRDLDWVAAMQEEMQQFYNQQVWKLVPLPAGKIAIGIKWILKNKRDAIGIVVKNKARFVAQGHRQEKGIDYDEVFALVARIEAIRLFLAFASYMGFMVYQMDVKSAFLYGEIEEEVYVTQPKGFEDPHNPKHVYNVVKALYGLHQAPRASYVRLSTFLLKHHYRRGTIDKTLFIKKDSKHLILVQFYVDDIIFGSTNTAWCDEFEVLMKGEFEMSAIGKLTFFLGLQVKQLPDGIFISQDKYLKDMLKKYDMESVRTATTPYEVPKHKSKDEPDDAVNVHLYRSMISSLMYLTASKPDIMFAVSACSRHQFTPMTSHLNAVKKIFKYLKGQPNLGLWFPRDSPFQLEAYSDSDYAGPPMLLVVPVFLLVVLVHADGWVPTGSCTIPTGSYSFMLLNWFLLDDHNKVAYLEKGKGWEAYEQILDFLNRSHIRYALTHHPPIVFDSLVKQFWATATVRTLKAGPSEIIATTDGYPTDGSFTFYKAKPFRRTRTKRRRLRKTFTSSAFDHFQENLFAVEDTIPAGGVSAGSFMDPVGQDATAAPSSTIPAANKGKSPMVDDDLPIDLLTEQERILKNLHDYQLGEDLAKKLQAEQEAEFERVIATNSALSKQLLGDDVNEDNMNERLGWTMKHVKALSIVQLKHEFEYIQRTLERSNLLNFKRTTFRPTPTLEAPSAKRARQRVPQDVHAASSQVSTIIPTAPSIDADVSVHAAPSIAADVSVPAAPSIAVDVSVPAAPSIVAYVSVLASPSIAADVSVSAAPSIVADVSVPAAPSIAANVSVFAALSVHADTEVDADESRLDDTQTPSEHVSTEHTVDESTPSSSRIRRKQIAKKRVTLMVDEMVPTPLGSIYAYYDMEEHTKHFTSLRELLHMVEKNDLRKLLGDVDNFYQRQEPDTFALILWGICVCCFSRLLMRMHTLSGVIKKAGVFAAGVYILMLREATLKRMQKHGLEVPKMLVGGDLTMAEQLVSFIKAALINAQSAA